MALGNKTLDDLLAPLSAQLGHSAVAENVAMPAWEHEAARVTDRMGQAELVELFAAEAEKVRVTVHRCDEAGLAACLAAIVGEGTPDTHEPCTVVASDDDGFASAGVYEALRSAEAVSSVHVWDPALERANVDAALVATYGITRAASGIAETATIVQPTNARCGRAVSLLPLVHVAVVEAATIVPTMREVMREYATQGKLPSQVCLISGPSATSDIELVRVEGVHGPMYVHYVIVG